MSIASCSRAALAALTLVILASPCAASGPPALVSSSVLAETSDLKQLIADGAAGSAAFRALVSTIEQSDLVVYLRCRVFTTLELRGQLTFLSATGGRRYVVVELGCLLQTRDAQMGILAHELQHAVEIALAPSITDTRTLERFYAGHGRLVRSDAWARAYETTAAVESARRVQRELGEAGKLRAEARAARVQRELRQIDTGGFK
jgi:hypothetical protein